MVGKGEGFCTELCHSILNIFTNGSMRCFTFSYKNREGSKREMCFQYYKGRELDKLSPIKNIQITSQSVKGGETYLKCLGCPPYHSDKENPSPFCAARTRKQPS